MFYPKTIPLYILPLCVVEGGRYKNQGKGAWNEMEKQKKVAFWNPLSFWVSLHTGLDIMCRESYKAFTITRVKCKRSSTWSKDEKRFEVTTFKTRAGLNITNFELDFLFFFIRLASSFQLVFWHRANQFQLISRSVCFLPLTGQEWQQRRRRGTQLCSHATLRRPKCANPLFFPLTSWSTQQAPSITNTTKASRTNWVSCHYQHHKHHHPLPNVLPHTSILLPPHTPPPKPPPTSCLWWGAFSNSRFVGKAIAPHSAWAPLQMHHFSEAHRHLPPITVSGTLPTNLRTSYQNPNWIIRPWSLCSIKTDNVIVVRF